MHVHIGERVYWGAPEVIYLEGRVKALNEQTGAVCVQIERATPNSARLIGSALVFASEGIMPVHGRSPEGLADHRAVVSRPQQPLSDDDKLHCAAVALIYQKYGDTLAAEQRREAIEQIVELFNKDSALRARIMASMDLVLKHGS